MQEYWVNVYEGHLYGGKYSKTIAEFKTKTEDKYTLYRIHVKLDCGKGTRRAIYPFRMVNGVLKWIGWG